MPGDALPSAATESRLHLGEESSRKASLMTQPDMSQLMRKAQEMQEQLKKVQQEILETVVHGEAGNGLVKITMTGGGEVTDTAIDPRVVDPDDVETLQDLITGAFNDAHRRIAEVSEQKLGPISGFGGGSLGSMF